MIFIEIFANFVFDAPPPPQARSGSRQSAKKPFARAHLAAKGIRPALMPGVD
jgi:hypothetical protein